MTSFNRLFSKRKGKLLTGFTLIELLVVIASIGLLLTVLAVFASALRDRGRDTRITTNMDLLRKRAATYLVISGNYINLCADYDVTILKKDIETLVGTNYNCQVQTSPSNEAGESYCIEVQLNSGKWRCIDSSMRSQQYNTNPACDIAQVNKSCQ